MMDYLLRFSISLGLTLAIEVPLSLLFGVRKKGLICVILVNVLTNPAVVFLLLLVRTFGTAELYYVWKIGLELAVIVTEFLIYRAFREELPVKKPLLMSVALNLCSYGIGLGIRFLGV